MSVEYSSRPSELVGLSDDPYAAWCLDEATFLWGRHVEGSMDEASAKAKSSHQKHQARLRVLQNLLTPKPIEEEEAEAPKGRFRDPAAMMKGGAKRG